MIKDFRVSGYEGSIIYTIMDLWRRVIMKLLDKF